MFIFEIIFGVLVISDMILTYMIIDSKRGVEVAKVARLYINDRWKALLITALAMISLIIFLRFVQMVWMLAPADIYMARLVLKNWRVYSGRKI